MMLRVINRQNGPHNFVIEEVNDNQSKITHVAKKVSITVDASIDDISQAWYHWENGGAYIQNAFSFMNADEREFLMTGITPSEWDTLFPPEEEGFEREKE